MYIPLQFARISLKRVNEVIWEEEPEISESKVSIPIEKGIKVKDLDFYYNLI